MGSLVGAFDSSTATVNLTTAGVTDWIHWTDVAVVVRKSGGGSLISTYTRSDTSTDITTQYSGDPRTVSWSDGSPTGSGSDTVGIYVNGTDVAHLSGFQITAPAGTLTRKLICNFGYFNNTAAMTASLSDGSASTYVDTAPFMGATSIDRNYVFIYRADAAEGTGATITITWANAANGGNVTINGATLEVLPGPSLGTVPSGTALTVPAFTAKFAFFDTGDYSV